MTMQIDHSESLVTWDDYRELALREAAKEGKDIAFMSDDWKKAIVRAATLYALNS